MFSARYCFVENLHRRYVSMHHYNHEIPTGFCSFSGILDDMEYECYCQWFDHMLKKDPPHIDLIG